MEADKKPPENKSYVERISDFSGGLNTTISGSLLSSREAQVANDISFEQKGTIKPRRGRVKRYLTPFTPDSITGIGTYYKSDGTSRLIVSAGDKLYSDTPHMSIKWSTKNDFEQTGTLVEGFATTTRVEGSVTNRKTDWAEVSKGEDALLWTASGGVISTVVGDNPLSNMSNSIKATIDIGSTDTYVYNPLNANTKIMNYFGLSGYIKNIDATTGIRLVALKEDGTVLKGSDYVTGTEWTKQTLKFNATEMESVLRFGVEVKGEDAQSAQFTGLYYHIITESNHNDSGYIMPDVTYYELYGKKYAYTDTPSFSEGTLTGLVNGAGLTLDKAYLAGEEIFNTKTHFDLGTYNNTSGAEVINSVVLSRKTS